MPGMDRDTEEAQAPRLHEPAPLDSGQEVLAEVMRREHEGDPGFQMTPKARMDVATMLQSLPKAKER